MTAKKGGSNLKVERTILIRSKESFIQQLLKRKSLGENLYNRSVQTLEELEKLDTDFYNWNDITNEVLKQSFNKPDNEYYYKYSRLNTMSGFLDYTRGVNTDNPQYRIKQVKSKINNCLNELNQLIEKAEIIEGSTEIKNHSEEVKVFYDRGFIIHGHDEIKKFEVARFIEHDLKRKVVILHDEPNGGKTIIEKFEANSNVDFAVALWTADDDGKSKKENQYKDRARQNVIFETGFFIGKLSRQKVIVLYQDGVEIPSDYHGVIFIAFDNNWKNDLRKEIEVIYNP